MISIHPTAVIGSQVELGADTQIGPFCILEDGVSLGERCRIESRAVIKSGTVLGYENTVCEGTVLGAAAQHVSPPATHGGLIIGNKNTFRENVTAHRALHEGEFTRIGNENYLMVNAHVGHDAIVGNGNIIANNAMLGGHTLVEDFTFISGGVAVHQFCRVGTMVMIGGQAHVVQDAPPYVTIDGLTSRVVGLNRVGLKRRGFSAEHISELKDAYRIAFRSGLLWSEALKELQLQFLSGPALHFHEFLAGSTRRGFVHERRTPRGTTVKLPAPSTNSESSREEIEVRRVG